MRKSVGSSLTSVDLAGLTRVELTFALLLAAASGGLVLALGLTERRRSFAIATALGAKARHLRGMIVSEAIVLGVLGLAAGAVIGSLLSAMLVKVLDRRVRPAAVRHRRAVALSGCCRRSHARRLRSGERGCGAGCASTADQRAARAVITLASSR